MSRRSRITWSGITLFCLALAMGTAAADDIALSVDHAVTPGELALTWSGGETPYLVFGSDDPAAVVTASTRVATTGGTGLDLPQGAPVVEYFLVVNVDRASAVTTTSACLTADTGAESAVLVDLRDSLGNPLPGAAVLISSDQGTIGGTVDESDGTYHAVLTPPGSASAAATIGITAEGVALNAAPVVDVVGPLTGTGGGAGGCPADGNLRVRVVDEAGLPLLGANVMLGQSESLDLFETFPGVAPDGDNTGVTDPDGYVEFRDFGANLDGPQTITAAAGGRRYVSLVAVDAADVLLPLELVDPALPSAQFTGDITNVPAPSNDPIELAFTLPDLSIDDVFNFSLSNLLADDECYDAGGVAGQIAIPGSIYMPAQCAVQILFCIQSLPEHPYTSAPVPYGDRQLLALRGSAPLSALTSGDLSQALANLTLNGIGAVSQTASVPGPTTLNVPITQSMPANLDCSIDNAPANSDVFCVGAGDWDSSSDPGLTPGTGRMFLSGFRLGDSAGQTGPFAINGVTTVSDTGDFAGIEYIGAAIALYNDPAKPGIPPGTARGTSAVVERSGTAYDGTGGAVTFDDFFPVRTLSRAGRDFTLGALPGSGHPAAQLTRVTLDQVVTQAYDVCPGTQSNRVSRFTMWEVFLPGAATNWQLPEPPVGWPRQAAGGDLAGLVDPAITPENDALEQTGATFHLGTAPSFDYDALSLTDVRLHVTHVTRNEAAY
ncbi:MAG: hypothetical protein GY716_17650 [bacterium]|nr:hypothetical protein [bacterium]